MNTKKFMVILFLISSLLVISSCDRTDKVKHPSVNQLADNIEKIENVEKAYGEYRAFDLIIEVSVSDEFDVEKNGEKILNLAKKYLDTDAMEEMRKEQKEEYPLDVAIYIRDKDGKILTDIEGSRYEDHKRSRAPDYDEYVWKLSKWK